MGDKVKVSVLETNNVEELEGPCERLLSADIVDVNPSILGETDVDAVLRALAQNTGGGPTAAFTCFRGGNSSNLNASSGISCARGGNSSVI